MNTIRSVGYGWGVLCVAGGGSYYFAKRSINADREQRAAAEEQRRQERERLRVTAAMTREASLGTQTKKTAVGSKPAPNANNPASGDPAPVSHVADGDGGGNGGPAVPMGKFEAQEPFRSRKGDRFS